MQRVNKQTTIPWFLVLVYKEWRELQPGAQSAWSDRMFTFQQLEACGFVCWLGQPGQCVFSLYVCSNTCLQKRCKFSKCCIPFRMTLGHWPCPRSCGNEPTLTPQRLRLCAGKRIITRWYMLLCRHEFVLSKLIYVFNIQPFSKCVLSFGVKYNFMKFKDKFGQWACQTSLNKSVACWSYAGKI